MNDLERIAQGILDSLEEKDTVREIAIKSARAIIRLSSSIVHGMHKGVDGDDMMAEALDEVHKLKSVLSEHRDIWFSGIVQDALQEVAEASILLSIVKGRDLPEPHQLGMPGSSYLMGMADTIGELRRFALEALRKGDTNEAERYLDIMEEMFLVLMRFDYPDAIVSVRRKQDIARSILERTRGDVAMAVSSKRVQERIEALEKKL